MRLSFRALLRCPDCRSSLADAEGGALRCVPCDVTFSVEDGIPSLIGREGTVNAGEVATQDQVSDDYELVRYERPHSRRFHLESVEDLLRRVRLGGRILDNGCGNGFLIEILRRRLSSPEQLVGVDLSGGMLHRARARHDQLVRADSCRLPFADDTFDVVLSRSLLHHLPDPEQGIREMARVLRPGGEVVAMDTNKTIMSDLPRRVANRSRHFDEGHQNFVASELASRFARHLEVDKVDFRGYLAYPLLAFPDLLDFSRVLPLGLLTAPLLRLDSMLARVPALRRLGWALIVKAHKAS